MSLLRNLDADQQLCLLDIFNQSCKTGTIPGDWRTAIVAAVLKAGKPLSQPTSYSPIFLTWANSCRRSLLGWNGWQTWEMMLLTKGRAASEGPTALLTPSQMCCPS